MPRNWVLEVKEKSGFFGEFGESKSRSCIYLTQNKPCDDRLIDRVPTVKKLCLFFALAVKAVGFLVDIVDGEKSSYVITWNV